MRISQQIGWSQESKLIYQIVQQTERVNQILPGSQAGFNVPVSKQIGWSNESSLYYQWLLSLSKLTSHYANCCAPTTTTTTTTTFCPNCVAHDVIIGTQTWAACNLDVDHYLNGDPIPEITDPTVWSSLTTGAWCWYNNNSVNEPIYGKLYNWYAVNDIRGLAPAGYHVPSDAEWLTLTNGLAGLYSGGYLKETTLCHWLSPNLGATNSTGFTALGGGFRANDGSFDSINYYGLWWTSLEANPLDAWRRAMYSGQLDVQQAYNAKGFGFSVRLIKD